MAEIAGGHAVTKFHRRRANQQIGEGKAYTFGLVLSVCLPGAESDRHSDGINGQCNEKFLDKLLPLCFSLWRVRPGGAVGEFDQGYN